MPLTRSNLVPALLSLVVAAGAAKAEEVIVTSTAGGIMPVIKLDGQDVGDGTPGPVSTRLRQLYWDKHSDPEWSSAVNYD